jgi:hypothetical protein
VGVATLWAAVLSGAAAAQDISFTPEDGPGILSEAFEHVLPGGIHSTEYLPFGVDFSGFSIAGYGGDAPGWSFVDADGILSLNEYVGGRIFVPETGRPGVTDLLWVEASFVEAPEHVRLACWDSVGKFLGSSIADGGIGPDGGFLAKFEHPGIASFMLLESGDGHEHEEEHFGVRRIYLNAPVPAPGGAALLGAGCWGAGRRRRLPALRNRRSDAKQA